MPTSPDPAVKIGDLLEKMLEQWQHTNELLEKIEAKMGHGPT